MGSLPPSLPTVQSWWDQGGDDSPGPMPRAWRFLCQAPPPKGIKCCITALSSPSHSACAHIQAALCVTSEPEWALWAWEVRIPPKALLPTWVQGPAAPLGCSTGPGWDTEPIPFTALLPLLCSLCQDGIGYYTSPHMLSPEQRYYLWLSGRLWSFLSVWVWHTHCSDFQFHS